MIDTLDTFVEDVFAHLDEVKKVYPDIPVYLFGHSMVGEEKAFTYAMHLALLYDIILFLMYCRVVLSQS